MTAPERTRDVIDIAGKFSHITDLWSPRIVAAFNDNHVKLARIEGEFVWHRHDDTDELFIVHSGHLRIEMKDRTVALGPGSLFVVPRGAPHRPVADGPVELILIEPRGTRNTGDVIDARTVDDECWI